MRRRLRAWRTVRRGQLRWWLVYGPVRSGTTLMTDLLAPHARYVVSDWGLRHVLGGPLSNPPERFDPARYQRPFLAEVLAACDRKRRGPLDLVFKQANLRLPEYEVLVIGDSFFAASHNVPAAPKIRNTKELFQVTLRLSQL